ncbi:MAG: DUF86 domain-containing protein [Bacteroidota bacterium]
MPKSPLELLYHIRDECEFLESTKEDLPDIASLEEDERLKRAVVRSIEIIGEASKKLGAEFQSKHPEVEWRKMGGMRDFLIHVYFGINYNIVWDVLSDKIPELLYQVNSIIQEEENQE